MPFNAIVSALKWDDGQGEAVQRQRYAGDVAMGQNQFTWNEWVNNAVPMLQYIANPANRNTQDRTAEEISLASGDVKQQFAKARENLTRGLDLSRNPSDPGYADILAKSYGDEAGATSGAITQARRAERARVEDTNWGRTLQAIGAYQGLPQQANANLSTASSAIARSGAQAGNLAQQNYDAAGQAGYAGAYALNRKGSWFNNTPPNYENMYAGTTYGNGSFNGGGQQDPYGNYYDSRDSGQGSGGQSAADMFAAGMAAMKDGGKVSALRRRYAAGGAVTALSPEQETTFQDWYKGHSKALGLSDNPDDPEHFYDWRGAYLDGARPDEQGHWPSKHKLPGHPRTFIDPQTGEASPTAKPGMFDTRGGGPQEQYAKGGVIRGPGNGTSDSIDGKVRPGSYILSADTTRAIGMSKVHKMFEAAGVRPGVGGHDNNGVPVRLSNGEVEVPPEVVRHHGEEFFHKLQQKYHRPVREDEHGHANGGAVKRRVLPRQVEDAIFGHLPQAALIRRGHGRA